MTFGGRVNQLGTTCYIKQEKSSALSLTESALYFVSNPSFHHWCTKWCIIFLLKVVNVGRVYQRRKFGKLPNNWELKKKFSRPIFSQFSKTVIDWKQECWGQMCFMKMKKYWPVCAGWKSLVGREKNKQRHSINYQRRCECKFRPRTLRTSCVNRRASSTGRRLSRAVSIGSENQDLMGMALSG